VTVPPVPAMSDVTFKSALIPTALQNTVASPEKPLRVITKLTGANGSVSGSIAVTMSDCVVNLISPFAASCGTEINRLDRLPILGDDNCDLGSKVLAILNK